jgi:hypothetical protein
MVENDLRWKEMRFKTRVQRSDRRRRAQFISEIVPNERSSILRKLTTALRRFNEEDLKR